MRPRAAHPGAPGWSDIGSTRASTPIASTTAAGLGQRSSRPQKLGPDETHGEVAVAEANQCGGAAALKHVHHLPRVAVQAPAALVDRVGQPVGHEVGVGGDVNPVDVHVVTGVGDHAELAGNARQAAPQPGPARAAGEQDYQRGSWRPGSASIPARSAVSTHIKIYVSLLDKLNEFCYIFSVWRPQSRRRTPQSKNSSRLRECEWAASPKKRGIENVSSIPRHVQRVLGLHYRRQQQKKHGQLAIF